MWKEKAQTVLDGRDNHCPESKTGEDALLAGSRERFPELELEGESSLPWEEVSVRWSRARWRDPTEPVNRSLELVIRKQSKRNDVTH